MGGTQSLVLLIDDDAGVGDLVGVKLSEAGFSFVSATSGSEGLRIARERGPDVVMLDLRMPDMDGAEVLAVLREDADLKDLKVVVYTSFNEYGGVHMNERFVKEIGADLLIQKDADLDDVVRRVRTLVEGT